MCSVQMETGLGAEVGAQQWEGRKRGRKEDRSGAASGAGVFWESAGSHGGFLEDPVGDRVAGTGLGAGDQVPRCVLMCLCHCLCILVIPHACACWINSSLPKAPSTHSKVSLLGALPSRSPSPLEKLAG